MTLGSLFSGVEGFGLGFKRAGFRVAWQVEREPSAQRILRRHWPGVPLHDDVNTVGGHNLEPVDVLCAGFPCQDVSVAGQRRGLSGERTGLFWQALRIADELKVGMVVLENVPGLLTSHGGRDFHTVLAALAERGFHDRAYRILDSRYFGVAQRRRRVFIVACRGTECGRARAVLFERARGSGRAAAGREARAGVAATLGGRAPRDGGRVTYALGSHAGTADGEQTNSSHASGGPVGMGISEECAHSLRAGRAQAVAVCAFALRADPGGIGQGHNTNFVAFDNRQGADLGDAANTLRSDSHGAMPMIAHALTASAGHHGHSSPRGDGTDNLVASCLDTHLGDKQWLEDKSVLKFAEMQSAGAGVRRLTPTECERLQGFPDGWTCTCGVQPYATATCRCPDSPRYKALGNAVTVSVAEWIARRILAVEAERAA